MHPFIYIGNTEVSTYVLLITFGLILGVAVVLFRSKKYPITKSQVILSFIFIIIGLIFGGKLLNAITQIPTIIQNWDLAKTNPSATLNYVFGGLVFYGGLIGTLIALKLFCFQFDKPFLLLTNLYVPIIPLVHTFGRIGCFFMGCCYGIEYHGFLALHFPDDAYIEGVNLVSRFPVQLLESFLNFILFIVLFIYTKKPRKEGSVLGIYLISYGIIRFGTEFLRGDAIRGIFLGISTSQWVSFITISIGIYLIKRKGYSLSD